MSDEQQRPDVRRLWQSQVDESIPMSLDDLRNRASKMHRLILLRAFVAGLASLIFAGLFGVVMTLRVSVIVSQADIEILRCLFLIATAYSFWHLISLLRRMRAKTLTEGEPSACATFYRSELDRQRKFYRHSAVWVPLTFSAVWVWGLLSMRPFRVIMIVIWVLFVPVWVYQSLEIARKSQRELDGLDSSFR